MTVVIATRDRVAELRRTLAALTALPESPAIIVVDNGSRDGTARAVRREFPRVTVIRNRRNRKAAARNQGVRRAATRYVAFSDDDSWWAPGALARACDLLSRHPRVGVIAARTLVGADAADDPLNGVLAASPVRPAGPHACTRSATCPARSFTTVRRRPATRAAAAGSASVTRSGSPGCAARRWPPSRGPPNSPAPCHVTAPSRPPRRAGPGCCASGVRCPPASSG